MKKYLCDADELSSEKIWEFSLTHDMLIHFVGKSKEKLLMPATYTYELMMAEEDAIVFVLSMPCIRLYTA